MEVHHATHIEFQTLDQRLWNPKGTSELLYHMPARFRSRYVHRSDHESLEQDDKTSVHIQISREIKLPSRQVTVGNCHNGKVFDSDSGVQGNKVAANFRNQIEQQVLMEPSESNISIRAQLVP